MTIAQCRDVIMPRFLLNLAQLLLLWMLGGRIKYGTDGWMNRWMNGHIGFMEGRKRDGYKWLDG